MKVLKKCDFKKLALLGIAGGTMLACDASAAAAPSNSKNPNAKVTEQNCGGNSGCGGIAYRNAPSQGAYYYNDSQSSCNATTPSQGSCGNVNPSRGSYNQSNTSHGSCGNTSAPQGQYYSQPQGSCGNTSAPQGQYYSQPQGSCGNTSAPQGWQSTNSQPNSGSRNSAGSSSNNPQTADNGRPNSNLAGTYKTTNHGLMTESDLMSQLNDQSKATYKNLDESSKTLALKMASQECKGLNDCKGLNSCKSEKNSCAGKGSCAGQAAAGFKDKNLAVKVAAMKMAEKRGNVAPAK